jgi:hypothetical protein
MWWNVTGLVVAYLSAWLLSLSCCQERERDSDYTAEHTIALMWTRMDTLLAGYFLMMLTVLWLIDKGLSHV